MKFKYYHDERILNSRIRFSVQHGRKMSRGSIGESNLGYVDDSLWMIHIGKNRATDTLARHCEVSGYNQVAGSNCGVHTVED